jgi:hypothetical protein
VEGAQADQVLAHALQFDAACLDQSLHRDFPFDSFQHLIRESGHSVVLLSLVFPASSEKPVKLFFHLT